MKKISTMLIIALMGVIGAKAQFVLTPNGFVDSKNEKNPYLLIEVPDQTQEQLYQKSKVSISKMFNSPQDVISESRPDMITVNGFSPEAIGMGKLLGMTVMAYNINYTMSFRFKDGKIRIDSPTFRCYDNDKAELVLVGSANFGFGAKTVKAIFNKKGDLKSEQGKKNLEDFFNKFLSVFMEEMMKNEETW